ncbi:MAG: hypothetical protein KJN76_11395 [Eudoraea sp.]|nr:hypothetical protein [Eudoraea sp.]
MNYRILPFALLLSCLLCCQNNISVKKDAVTGLISQGVGLSCEDVQLSDGTNNIHRNTFTYGEEFHLDFNDITGFEKVDNTVFPGMELLITGQKGDTIMHNPDLYSNNSDGFDISLLLLKAKITVANPIHSNNIYTLNVNIWDKKGDGTFESAMDLKVTPNKLIDIQNNSIAYDEIYLFSQERNKVLTTNEATFDENIYMVFEGLDGFKTEDGKAYLGLSLKATDAEGHPLLDEADLAGASAMEDTEIKKRISPNFIFTGSDIKNPVSCEITIWDKNSEHSIAVLTKLSIK